MDSYSSLVFRYFLSSTACPSGWIGSRDVSKVSFWNWSPVGFTFPMASYSSLEFGDFLSTAAFSLGRIGSGGGITDLQDLIPRCFSPSMGCGGRWKFLPSAPSLLVSVFHRSDKEEDSEVSLFILRLVMSLMVIISSEALIYLTSMAPLNMSVNRATHIVFVFRFSGSVSLIHRWIFDFISGSDSAKRSSSSWPGCLNFLTALFSFRLEMIWLLNHPLIARLRLLRRWGVVPWRKTWGWYWDLTSCFWIWLFWR